jgi:hypothetical protein
MNTLLLLLALIGQPARMHTDIGTCYGTVIAPGQATMEGTCSLEPGTAIVFPEYSDEAGVVVSARTLESGRVVVTFVDGGAL